MVRLYLDFEMCLSFVGLEYEAGEFFSEFFSLTFRRMYVEIST